ncbi:MAG: isochorismate synthase [Actinomycetota bacterium]
MSRRLTAKTTRLSVVPRLTKMVPPAGAAVWITPSTSLVGFGQVLRLGPCGGSDRFETLAGRLQELFSEAHITDDVDLPGSGPMAFGSFTFDENDADSAMVIPELIYGVSDDAAWKTEMSIDPPDFNSTGRAGNQSRLTAGDDSSVHWNRICLEAQDKLADGTVEKVVLARKVLKELQGEPDEGEIVRHLADAYPGCFTFAFERMVGASPELLVRRLGDIVESMPIAGSAPRGADAADDDLIGAGLIASAKNQTEHEITKRDVVDKLAPFCSQMEVEATPSLLLLANVQHLSTKVQGKLNGHYSALQLAGALHPTAAVCGMPNREAMDFIRMAEGFDRGRYAAPVGWMDHRGDGEWALALRCADIGDSSAGLYAGAGIVSASVAEAEFEETEIKLKAILSALNRGVA